jgi:hypothetical protein
MSMGMGKVIPGVGAVPAVTGRLASGQQFERPREAGADADGAKIPPVGRQNPVDLPPFGDRGDRAVDEPESEGLELGVELERSHDVDRQGEFVFVRNNSDSSPSFASVDSNRRVDGGRRPV